MVAAVIDSGAKIDGSLSFAGKSRIGGSISGSIFSNSEVVITESAVVTADIHADILIVSGVLKGDIVATSRVEFLRPAQFEGTISSPSLSVQDGVIFHGKTAM